MLLFFGTRASKIKARPIGSPTECPYCQSKDSFVATTFGRYFHLFWIPLFPLYKTTILECSHCKRTYAEHELPPDLKQALLKSNRLDPPKRPLWHGFGCLVMAAIGLVIVVISIGSAVFWSNNDVDEVIDGRKLRLQDDIEKTTAQPDSITDPVSFHLKNCIDHSIDGIDTDKIRYYSRSKGNRLLVLLKVNDLKKTKAGSRKEIVFAVEDCLDSSPATGGHQVYIGVDGKWNMVLVKTPGGESLDGRFAETSLLLPFYGAKPVIKQDSVQKQ
ncbi:zinc-ribbon domain-containing protein [Sinomicrobium weinanense]|uniref:Zinc-ribbon domain-containing protein n=1 Tax=Sinomicrobium weinanense TaxID=2842200 RepID=A0A926Q5K7_9FLAO|nr:zinc-ribbon domain-containing protein [Sinomicrobium weinanense]MBC9798266.1 zinc-ribbon domain-containing protein [Sinomicrobium weinanense]MBU3125332.1 zinc ribbon domain-containing protein [Sinomicrobium weinanense]